MGAKFHAMTEEDYRKLGPVVRTNVGMDGYTALDSNDASYNFGVDEDIKSLRSLHLRKVIRLTAPTFNYVLSRSSTASLLKKMLDIEPATWNKILNVDVVYDLNSKSLIAINDTEPSGNYLYGAEIAAHYIDMLDIEEAKLDCLYRAFSCNFKDSVNPRDIITIDKSFEGMYLTAGYYAHFDEAVVVKNLKRGVVFEEMHDNFIKALFPNSDSRFSYLLNMNQDKSGLYGMLNYYIAVVPEEMRPKIDRAEHKLTKRYTSVIKADFELRTIKSANANPKDVALKYKALDTAVSKLQYKNVGLGQASTAKDDNAILERIKTKKGAVRMNNLGKRQDYSGRAVVCINPFLPIDTIRIPKSMLPKLLEYHVLPKLAKNIKANIQDHISNEGEHVRNIYDKLRLSNLDDPESKAEVLRIINDEKLLDDIPVVLGRQPTLHKQSLQGFHVEISNYQAIEVSPLVCPAFNMDFDGDAGHVEVPLSPEAIKDVRDLIMTTQNLYLAKTGEVTTVPRQDMVYGLYICTKNEYVLGQNKIQFPYENLEQVRQAVMKHKIRVSDTVTVMKPSMTVLAGDAAFMACFAEGDVVPRGMETPGRLAVTEITSKTITKYVMHILRKDSAGNNVHKIGTGWSTNNTVVGAINRLVELGFRVAKLYTPNVSIITKTNNVPKYDNALSNFHTAMEKADFYYDLGLDTADTYKLAFNKYKDQLSTDLKESVIEKLGKDNGYVALSLSGARGSIDNLNQMFSCKGQVKKNSTEAFDALIDNSYASQLTPMEQFVAAYGGRQGQIDKSLKTGDTGYAMRQMWHAMQGYKITTDDCGTNKGLLVSKKYLTTFLDTTSVVSDEEKKKLLKEVNGMFRHAIVGRYRVGSNMIISESEAEKLANDASVDSIEIRSPLFCQNPCCRKCYGIDWSTHKPIVKNLAAGIMSAQSIGEPGTQLTMKQFQKGGVAGKAEMTSAFDKVNNYILCSDIAKKSKAGNYPGYDPLAWETGEVHTTPTSDINMVKVTIGNNKRHCVIMPKSIALKEYAEKGQGLAYKHGDYNIHEILEYCGIEDAQRYLVFKLYNLYKSEVEISLVHFEILASAMTRYMITDTDRKDLLIGQYCTGAELFSGSVKNTKYIPRLISVNNLMNASLEAMDSIIMEKQAEGLSRICLLELEDKLIKPINRLVLGLTILEGSHNPDFIPERKEII